MDDILTAKPLDDETVWGELVINTTEKIEADYCPYKEKRCSFWDHGCQRGICYLEDEND